MKKEVIYVGHRGTKLGVGVENTKEAYVEAAKLGYKALETDIRVTLDKVYIAQHDNSLTRLTKNSKVKTDVVVEGSYYKDLKDLELTEITRGTLRKGRVCLFDEYLDVCKEYNCIPVIELKWTNGIYSDNDSYDPLTDKFTKGNYSNLDGLIQKVYEHGLENEAYIMTSMMGCLLYVKENYPNIKLQWLCNARVKEFMEYAGKKGIHLDVEYNAVDDEVMACAKKYNQLVNIWTLDDESLLQKYLDLGVDMITTNWIKPR